MTVDFTNVNGVGGTLNERLHDNGYEDYEDVLEADTDELTELKSVTEDRAMALLVYAEDQHSESEDSEDSTEEAGEAEEVEEEDVDSETVEETEDVEAHPTEDESQDSSEEGYSISFNPSPRQREILTMALMEQLTELKSRNRARADATDDLLVELRDGYDITVTEEELNAFYSALRKRRKKYKGNNHVDLMNQTGELLDRVQEVREEKLF